MEIKEYILKNRCLEIHVLNLGGIIKNIYTRDCRWHLTDVILGFDNPEQYASPEYLAHYPYFGAIIGRYANRIQGASFDINGQTYKLTPNEKENCLHGGAIGLDRQIWDVEQPDYEHLNLHYKSPDGENGFPGNLDITVHYSIEEHVFRIIYEATCDQPTYVNLTSHPYFNLNPGEETIRDHELRLYSKKYLETTPELIPTGNILDTDKKHSFNFNKPLSLVIEEGGIDASYAFEESVEPQMMAELASPKNGIDITILSDYPCMQVYTGNGLDVSNGKEGRTYGPYSGIALEPQMYPDSPHHPHFPSTLLRPGVPYRHETIYTFNCFSVDEKENEF